MALELYDVFCLGSSTTRFYLKSNAVSFRETLEPRRLDGRVVNKNITTVVLSDKTKSLLFIKPLHSSLWHSFDLLSKSLNYGPSSTRELVLRIRAAYMDHGKMIIWPYLRENLMRVPLRMSRKKGDVDYVFPKSSGSRFSNTSCHFFPCFDLSSGSALRSI